MIEYLSCLWYNIKNFLRSVVCNMVVEYPEKFLGEIDKITLVSSPCFYLGGRDGGIDIEQKLTINSSGKVTYTSKEWANPIPVGFNEGKWRKATLPKEQAKEILEKIIEPFRDYQLEAMATDVGFWYMTAYNTAGEEFKYEGCLFPDSFERAEEISYYVRNALMMPDLYVFDGQHGLDNTKYIYISVEFTDGGKTYYYQTTDTTIEIGDQVIVPVGRTEEKIVTRLNLSRGLSAKKNKFTKKSKLRTALCLLNFDFYNFFIQSPLYV